MSNKQCSHTLNSKQRQLQSCGSGSQLMDEFMLPNPSSRRALRTQCFVSRKQRASQSFFSQKRGVCLTNLKWFSTLNECYGFSRGTQYPLPLWRKLPWIIYLLLLFFKLLGLKAESHSFGFLSGYFIFEFTSNRCLFHPALLQMPRTNHMADFLMAALMLLKGSLSRKHQWKNKSNRQQEQSNH